VNAGEQLIHVTDKAGLLPPQRVRSQG
jgi:hypothetical protein